MSDDIVLCVSSEILLEYTEILAIFTSRGVAENIVNAIKLRPNTQFIEPHYKWLLLPDPDDNKFIECAIDANALYIISGDKDLLDIQKFNNIQIFNTKFFCEKFIR